MTLDPLNWDNIPTMSLAEGIRLTRISSKEPGGFAQLRFRPEGVYRGSGKTWGFSTADLSFAVHNELVQNGQFLDLTSEQVQPDGTVKEVKETLVYIKQDEKVPSKGEWGPHYFVKPDSLGKDKPEIVSKGREVSFWKSTEEEVSPQQAELAKTVTRILSRKNLSTNPFLVRKS